MDFRYFIYVSVAIHVLGGLVLFFHHNPFQSDPKPIEKVQELAHSETEMFQEKKSQKPSIAKKVASYKKKHFKKSIPKPSPKKEVKKPVITEKPAPLKENVVQKPALAPVSTQKETKETKTPAPTQKETKETKTPAPVKKGKIPAPSQDVTQLTKLPLAKKKTPINSPKFKSFSLMKLKQGIKLLEYPLSARRAKQQGTVSVIYFVTKTGFIEKLQLQSSSGHRELDNFVLRSLSRYEFKPNQSSWVRHKVEFVLEGEEEETLKLRSF